MTKTDSNRLLELLSGFCKEYAAEMDVDDFAAVMKGIRTIDRVLRQAETYGEYPGPRGRSKSQKQLTKGNGAGVACADPANSDGRLIPAKERRRCEACRQNRIT